MCQIYTCMLDIVEWEVEWCSCEFYCILHTHWHCQSCFILGFVYFVFLYIFCWDGVSKWKSMLLIACGTEMWCSFFCVFWFTLHLGKGKKGIQEKDICIVRLNSLSVYEGLHSECKFYGFAHSKWTPKMTMLYFALILMHQNAYANETGCRTNEEKCNSRCTVLGTLVHRVVDPIPHWHKTTIL